MPSYSDPQHKRTLRGIYFTALLDDLSRSHMGGIFCSESYETNWRRYSSCRNRYKNTNKFETALLSLYKRAFILPGTVYFWDEISKLRKVMTMHYMEELKRNFDKEQEPK